MFIIIIIIITGESVATEKEASQRSDLRQLGREFSCNVVAGQGYHVELASAVTKGADPVITHVAVASP